MQINYNLMPIIKYRKLVINVRKRIQKVLYVNSKCKVNKFKNQLIQEFSNEVKHSKFQMKPTYNNLHSQRFTKIQT